MFGCPAYVPDAKLQSGKCRTRHPWEDRALVAINLGLLAGIMISYPHLHAAGTVIVHASLYGFCGGVFSVIYFTGFGKAFGPTHLGKIQGAAQVMTVVASALGPWCLARVWGLTGSYFPLMTWVTPAFLLMAVLAWFTRMPHRDS